MLMIYIFTLYTRTTHKLLIQSNKISLLLTTVSKKSIFLNYGQTPLTTK